jgi:hypothetical protein
MCWSSNWCRYTNIRIKYWNNGRGTPEVPTQLEKHHCDNPAGANSFQTDTHIYMHATKMSKSFVPAHWIDPPAYQSDVEHDGECRPSGCTPERAIAWDRSRYRSETTRPMKEEDELSAAPCEEASYPYHWGRASNSRLRGKELQPQVYSVVLSKITNAWQCDHNLQPLSSHSATHPSQLTCVIPPQVPFAVHFKKLQII